MKTNLITKLALGALIVGATALNGCQKNKSSVCETIKWDDKRNGYIVLNKYLVGKSDKDKLLGIACHYFGKRKKGNPGQLNLEFDLYNQTQQLEKACEMTDTNSDKILSSDEINTKWKESFSLLYFE